MRLMILEGSEVELRRELVRALVSSGRARLEARYACGHRVPLAPRADAELECACARHAPLQGLVARAA